LTSLAHRELEQHKELREMVRIAAWEMPLLSQLAKPFHPPEATQQPLRWRYTTYLGESHPAARKVVVEFKPRSLNLDRPQRVKLLKLVGPRYNPTTRTVRMSCESFETQAQNKRFLADTINKLIAEAQDGTADSFKDVPLDLRHHTPKQRHRFPRAWGMTPQRREELEGKRKTLLLEEGKRIEQDRLVSGAATLE
ncbi:mitochondrial ribosomal subunit protein-domain-containing protein, partial [Neohortaea acidophila]